MDETLPLEAPVDSEMGLTDVKSADPTGWMWKPFQQIKRAYMKDLQRGYLPEFKPIKSDTTGSSIHTPIDDEGSKLRFPVGPDYNFMASDFKEELSSIIVCALTFLKDQDLSDTNPNIPTEKTNFFSFDLLDTSRLHPVASLGRFGNNVRYTIGCRFAKQFMELGRRCDLSEPDFIAGLSRCKPWDAKIWGIYHVEIEGGRKGLLIVKENVTYGQKLIGQYDLKGALHNRLVPSFDVVGNVILDQNFVNDMKVFPSYVTEEVKGKLLKAVLNDTGFLNGIKLLVGRDDEKGELVCGIIDYLRQYTWEKKVETVYKSTFVVQKKMKPTVIPPEEYKKSFFDFIDMHFQSVPDDWCSQRPPNPCTLCNVANSS